MSVRTRITIAVLAVVGMGGAMLVVVPMLMLMGVVGASSTDATGTTTGGDTCRPVVTTGGRTMELSPEQITNAKVVIQTGLELEVPARGLVVGVATALQESSLENIPFGDRDSVGLFQQRNAWGAYSIRMDAAASARMFYTGGRDGQPGLLDIKGWASLSVTAAAQSVQRSAFPLAYAKWEPLAGRLVASVVGDEPLGCSDVLSTGLPTGTVGSMLTTALKQQGSPYVWGAVGPEAFDCSGLVVYAWRAAGFRLTVRTAAQMYDVSQPVPRGQEQPGDLLFGDFGDRGPGPGHVMIVVRKGLAVQAPHTGDVVKLTDYTEFPPSWTLGRLKPSALVKI